MSLNKKKQKYYKKPLNEGEAQATIHVGNLSFNCKDNDLEESFKKFGIIKSVRIPKNERGLSKGFGFVEYQDEISAFKACQQMNNSFFFDREILVEISTPNNKKN